jgi:hypothetical protein
VPIEVIKVQEIIKEVEKIVYINQGGKAMSAGGGMGMGMGGLDSDCDCLTGARFLTVWNKLFKLSGAGSDECLTEEQFVNVISKSFKKNLAALEITDARTTVDSTDLARMSNTSAFASIGSPNKTTGK